MKVKSGFRLLTVCGENVIIAEGIENINFNKVIGLNESAAYLWNFVVNKERFTIDEMVAAIIEEYDVAPEVARADCQETIKAWNEAGIIEMDDVN
ncbi:PqqD family protein [Prevotella sp.]|uniref:PqqD family protein n=1 Tax=Prevotella sp. TaxID=59823 RepID=UPI002F92B80E